MSKAYRIGKQAALEDLAGLIDDGASLKDCVKVAHKTCVEGLNKNASEEDLQFKLGCEKVAYSFLEEATQHLGGPQSKQASNTPTTLAVFEKVADREEEEERRQGGVTQKAKQVGGAVKNNPGKSLAALAALAGGGRAAHHAVQNREDLSRNAAGQFAGGQEGLVGGARKGIKQDLGAAKEKAQGAASALKEKGRGAADALKGALGKEGSQDVTIEEATCRLKEAGLVSDEDLAALEDQGLLQ